jgi:PAS domain S-box-containing protein/putative nucleotidyltransferase with HDIG domain
MPRRLDEVALMTLFDAMIEGAVLVDPGSGKVVLANKAAAAMFGYSSPEAAVGADPLDHIPQEDKGRIAGIMAGYFVEGDLQNTIDLRTVALDGREVWIAALGVKTDYGGKPAGLILMTDITAQKTAGRALAEAEERQRQILEGANEPILVLQDANVVYANPKALELGSFSQEEIKGKPFSRFLLPEDRDRLVRRYLKKAGSKDYSSSFTARGLDKNGSVRWLEIQESSFIWEGRPAELCLMNDITERRGVEEALAASEKRYHLLTDNVSDVIWVADLQLKPTYFNPSITRLLGYTVEEAMAGALKMTPDSLDAAMKAFQDALHREEMQPGSASGSPKMDLAYIHKDGSMVWAETTVSFLRDSKGGPYAVLGILHDISERKKIEEALRRSEERFRALIENAADAIAVVSGDGQIIYESPNSQRAVEQRIDGVSVPSLLEIIHPDDVQKMIDLFEWVRDHPGETVAAEVRFKHKDGSWHTAEGTARNLLHDPRVDGIVVNYRNTSEKRRAEQALKESERRYRLLADNVGDVIFLLDMDFRPTYFSPSAARLSGYSLEEIMTEPLLAKMTPRSLELAGRTMSEALAEEERKPGSVGLRSLELELRHKNGSIRPAEATVGFLRDDRGKPNGIIGTLRDITERREAEEALRDSEKRYRLLAENLSDVIWVTGTDLKFTYVSPSVERLLGYSVEEAMATPVERIVTPASFEMAMKVMADEERKEGSGEFESGRSVTLELELPRKDGSVVWTENRVSYLRDAGGAVVGYLGVSRDIGERKKAEEALRTSEERFRTIFERSPIGAIVYDAEGRTVGANQACLETFGLSNVAEVRGPRLFDDPNLSERARAKLRAGKTLTIEGPLDLERARESGLYSSARSGTVHLSLTVTPLGVEKTGFPAGYLALVEDITERKKAEDALRASEERFRGLVETTSDWVWEVNAEGVYTYASPKVGKVLGYDGQELLGKTPFDFMPPREARRVAAIFKSHLAKQEPFAFLENVCRHKDGHPVVMETSGVPFFGSDGTLLGYRGIDRDVTERKRVARQLEQSLKRLSSTMESTIQAISTTIEARDAYTAGHQRRVTQLAGAIAKDMNLASAQIAGIRVAGLLHDIGKISIPTEILSKPGLLNDVEMSMIRTHPKVGYDILKGIEFQWPVAEIVLQHHERLDGSGYPSGIRGEKILLEARILAVADVVEAMSSHRPYRPARGIDKALEEIARGEGSAYDPMVVRACMEAFTKRNFVFEE